MVRDIKSNLSTLLDKIYKEVNLDELHNYNAQSNSHLKKVKSATLFADFGGSTGLIDNHSTKFSIWLLKSYLGCVAFIVHEQGGDIVAFEGDGIMGIFYGENKEDRAVKCAFKIQWVVENIIQPKIDRLFPSINYNMDQVVGIDSSELIGVDTNIWDNYDKLWVGRSANYSANLTCINDPNYSTYITADVYNMLSIEYKGDLNDIFWEVMPGKIVNAKVFRSNKILPL